MNLNYFDSLIEAFGRKEVVLFLGPFFVVANAYPAIRSFLNQMLKNYSDTRLQEGDLYRTAQACSMLWKQELKYPASDKKKGYMNPLYYLATGWPVKLRITRDFDLILNEFLYIPSYYSASDRMWQKDLENFLNRSDYIFHAFGSAGDPESMEEIRYRFEKMEEDNVMKAYFTALFQKFSPLFIGFEPDDFIFRKLQEICKEQSQAKPWYAFFVSPADEKLNPGIDLRVISPESFGDSEAKHPLSDVNEMQCANTGFFINLLSFIKE